MERTSDRQGNSTGLLCTWLTALALCACSSVETSSAKRSAGGTTNGPVNNAGFDAPMPMGTNVSFGGAQDFGFFRGQLEAGLVPSMASLDAPGFFAEHHVQLPPPACGARICLQPMVAVMGNLMNGENCTMLNLGLNSPIAADPGERPPLSLAVVVDVSGSMQGAKIEFVRQGLELLIDGMRDEDELAIITYSDAAEVVTEMTPVGSARVELRRVARGLQADGATNLHAGLIAGYRQVLDTIDGDRQNRVILLSDGVPTAGITHVQSILEESRGYNSDGIGLTTVGLGHDFNIELMRGLAEQADGNFYFLEDSGAVDEVFDEELSFFVVPVAFDLELSLTAGSDYEFGRAMGSPLGEDRAAGGALEIPSVFVAHRDLDIAQHLEPFARYGSLRLGADADHVVELLRRREVGHDLGAQEVQRRDDRDHDTRQREPTDAAAACRLTRTACPAALAAPCRSRRLAPATRATRRLDSEVRNLDLFRVVVVLGFFDDHVRRGIGWRPLRPRMPAPHTSQCAAAGNEDFGV